MADFLDSPAYERDLSDRLIGGDPEAAVTFLAHAHASVYATAARLTGDRVQRREWTQATFLGLLDDLRAGRFEWRQGGSFWSWARRRAWFRLLDLYCRERRTPVHATEALELIRERTGEDDPAAELERVGDRNLLDQCLASLVHEHHRRALSLLLLEQASYPDIAQRMGVPLTTVHRWVRRARLLAREGLADKLGLRSRGSTSWTDEAHASLQRLVLVSEDLHDSELATADAHRGECAVCDELLARVRRIESGARLAGELPPFDDPAVLPDALSAEANESSSRLRARPELAHASAAASDPDSAAEPVPRGHWLVWIPVGALVAVLSVALWPRPVQESALRAGTRVVHAGVRAGNPAGFATGDEVALELELARPARLVVAHVGPDGNAELLVPESGTAPPVFPAGRQRVPTAHDPRWTLKGPPGRDAYVVVAVEGWGADVDAVLEELRKVPEGPANKRLEEVRRRFTRRWGPVQVVEVNRGR